MLSAGEERFKSDKRQLGGLMLVLATAALVFPQASLAGALGPVGSNPTEGIGLSAVCAGVFVITMGVLGMVTGYLTLVHDAGHKYLTGFLILFTQLAYVPFITDLTAVGRGARSCADGGLRNRHDIRKHAAARCRCPCGRDRGQDHRGRAAVRRGQLCILCRP